MPTTRLTASCNHAYQLTQDVRKFAHEAVWPAISKHNADKSRSTRKRDRAIECINTRIATWLATFEKLNQTRDMQAIGTGARCVFEHYLDLVWLQKFPEEKWLDRYWAFPDVDRYWAAKKVVDHKLANVTSTVDITTRQQFMNRLDARTESIPALVSRLWGSKNNKPCWPKSHWTGMTNLRDRAAELGSAHLDTYIQIYPTLCALVHPGATPFLGDFEWLEVQVGYGYFYTFHHAWKATELTVQLMGIGEQIPTLDAFRFNLLKWLEEAEAARPPL